MAGWTRPELWAAPVDLKNNELLERIETLRSPAYRNLSRTHAERLDRLEAEARGRKLIDPKGSIQ